MALRLHTSTAAIRPDEKTARPKLNTYNFGAILSAQKAGTDVLETRTWKDRAGTIGDRGEIRSISEGTTQRCAKKGRVLTRN